MYHVQHRHKAFTHAGPHSKRIRRSNGMKIQLYCVLFSLSKPPLWKAMRNTSHRLFYLLQLKHFTWQQLEGSLELTAICLEWWCGLLLSVNGPTRFPVIIHLSVIVTILSIYFYWIKLILMFIFWCFACCLLILHKHFIFIHCSASFTLTWVPKGMGAAYTADRVWKWELYLFQFYLTACYSFWFANDVT